MDPEKGKFVISLTKNIKINIDRNFIGFSNTALQIFSGSSDVWR